MSEINPGTYDPKTDKPQGISSPHIGIRWRQRFDTTIPSDDVATEIAFEAFSNSKYLLTAYDNKGDLMHYYLYQFPSDRGALFVQDPMNMKIVTVYEASYGYGPNIDYKLFQILLEEYKDCENKCRDVFKVAAPRVAKLKLERDNAVAQMESLGNKVSRIESEINTVQFQIKESQSELQSLAHKLTHTIEYRIELLAQRANDRKVL
jgi:uncharacterized protein (UPF0335 family)